MTRTGGERHPVRILFLVGTLQTGGVEKQLYFLTSRLDRTRFEPVVWCTSEKGLVGDLLRASGVRIIERALDLSSTRSVDALVSWLRELDVRMLFSFADWFWADVLLAKTAGIQTCVTRRASMRRPAVPVETCVRHADSDVNVVLCQAMYDHFLATEGMNPATLKIVSNGVPIPQRPARSISGQTVGNVANFGPVKGQRFLLEAMARLHSSFPGSELVIAGRTYGELEKLSEELWPGGTVKLVGEVADARPVYRRCSVYVQSSLSEGLCGAVLEAMASGLPVVATAVGGMPEQVVDGVTGYLVPPRDSGALAEAIGDLLGDKSRRTRMGNAGRERAIAQFSAESMTAGYTRLFESLLSLQPGERPAEQGGVRKPLKG